MNKQFPLVVIFGRTNVGKSTLFNRLLENRQAIVSDVEGTTRDSNLGTAEWRGKKFTLADTGGIMDLAFLFNKKARAEEIDEKVQKQARHYLGRADVILFVADNKTGIMPDDRAMAKFLKKHFADKEIILVVNKVDSQKDRKNSAEFYRLGWKEFMPVSAASGSGTGDLLDVVVKKIGKTKTAVKKTKAGDEDNAISVAILGQPNVGKSSLLNSLLGEERVIVSPLPHTTREPQDTLIEYKDSLIKIIDTAGISRRGLQRSTGKKGIGANLEKIGIAKSLHVLKKADIALLVLDISRPATHQDTKIIEEIVAAKKGLVIIANKWDLVPVRDTKKFTDYLRGKFPYIAWAPIQFISASTGEKVGKILDLILLVSQERKTEVSASALNSFMMRLVKIHRPARGRGEKYPRIRKFEQAYANPPEFKVTIGAKEDLHDSYCRFIENRLREKFGFTGTPISIKVAKGRATHGAHEEK